MITKAVLVLKVDLRIPVEVNTEGEDTTYHDVLEKIMNAGYEKLGRMIQDLPPGVTSAAALITSIEIPR